MDGEALHSEDPELQGQAQTVPLPAAPAPSRGQPGALQAGSEVWLAGEATF